MSNFLTAQQILIRIKSENHENAKKKKYKTLKLTTGVKPGFFEEEHRG